MSLSKEQIFAAQDSTVVEVDCPEWSGVVRMRSMTGTQRSNYEHWISQRGNQDDRDFRGLRERLIVACAVDEDGAPLFETDEDITGLSEKNANVIERLATAAQRVSGMLDDDVEEAAKN